MESLRIEYASTAVESLEDQFVSFARYRKISLEDARKYFIKLTSRVEKLIRDCPVRPVCYDATLYGFYNYSQISVDSYNFVFEFDKSTGLVMIALGVHERQSMKLQLERYLLSANR